MLFFGVLPLLLAAVSAEFCYQEMLNVCDTNDDSHKGSIENCNAIYGGFTHVEPELQGFANANMEESFYLLLLSSYFGRYDVNREGFKKLYRQYSDKLWEDAIDVMKYIAKRGGTMTFQQSPHLKMKPIELGEINSLAAVLDNQKELAKKAFDIHLDVHSRDTHGHNTSKDALEDKTTTIRSNNDKTKNRSKDNITTNLSNLKYDPAVAHYIEERFLEAYTERIRDLSGYITELKKLSHDKTHFEHAVPVSVFLFDEYLQKTL